MRKGIRVLLWFLALLALAMCVLAGVSRLGYHRSMAATVTEWNLRRTEVRSLYETKESAEKYMKEMESAKSNAEYEIPVAAKLTVSQRDMMVGETKVFFLNDTGHNEKAILYIPGGGYINQPTVRHWKFAETLALTNDAEVIVAVYPKLPKFTFEKAYEDLEKIIPMITLGFGWDNVTILGDSSGGGLALGYCEYLSYTGQRQPGNLILISPWVDATLENPRIPDYVDTDPMLAPEGMKVLAKAWAGDEETRFYKISPINGEMGGLSNVTVFSGTREIFYPDEQILCQKLQSAGVNARFYIGNGLNHDYPMHNTPEGKNAVRFIMDIIAGITPGEEEASSSD